MNKRIVSLLLAAVILLTMILTVTAFAVELPTVPLPSAQKGDVNGDGSINARDVVAIMRYLVGVNDDVFLKGCADYNSDGTINARDVLLIMMAIVNGEV